MKASLRPSIHQFTFNLPVARCIHNYATCEVKLRSINQSLTSGIPDTATIAPSLKLKGNASPINPDNEALPTLSPQKLNMVYDHNDVSFPKKAFSCFSCDDLFGESWTKLTMKAMKGPQELALHQMCD
jgi:hypothetical protein